jgi:hypothetical protein
VVTVPGKHTQKEKRQARHIAASERRRGISARRATSIGYATVNKRRRRKR